MPLEQATAPALPGLEHELEPILDDAGVIDVSQFEYTAERLRHLHPDKYAIAARAFYELEMSKRSICDLVKISPNTLNSIIEREATEARGFLIKRRRVKQIALTQLKAVETLSELLESKAAVQAAGIVGVTKAVQALEALVPVSQDEPKKPAATPSAGYDDFIDVTQDQGENGLGSSGNRGGRAPDLGAPRVGEESVGPAGSEAPDSADCTVEHYKQTPINQGFDECIDNGIDKSVHHGESNDLEGEPAEASGSGLCASAGTPAPRDERTPAPGGAGPGGGASAPPQNQNAFTHTKGDS